MNLIRSMPGVSWMRSSRSDSRIDSAVAVDVAVAVDGLAEEGDLLAPLVGELPDLGDDVLGRPALLGPADAGDDAVGAELVAADLMRTYAWNGRRPHRRLAHRIVALEAGRRPRGATPRCGPG